MKKIKQFKILFLAIIIVIFTGCSKEINVNINSDSNIEILVGEKYEIEYMIENCDDYTINYQYDDSVISIDDNVISGLNLGETTVTSTFVSGEYSKSFDFYVIVNIVTPTSIETEEHLTLYLGETHQIEWNIIPENASQEVVFRGYDGSILQVSSEGIITPKSVGSTKINVLSKDFKDIRCSIVVDVKRPSVSAIESVSELQLKYQESYQLKWDVLPKESVQDVMFEVANSDILSIDDNGLIYANCPGETIIKIISCSQNNIVKEIKVNVTGTIANELIVEENVEIGLGEELLLSYQINPIDAYQKLKFTTDNNALEINKDGVLIALKAGNYSITCNTIDGSNLQKVINVKVNESEKPVFSLFNNVTNDMTVNWNKTFDPLYGIRAFDNIDGDITNSIEVEGSVDTTNYGNYSLKYKVTNSKGETTEMLRNIEVVWNYSVTFIGHAGSYYGAMNSEEAILYAAKVLKYQAIEIDLKQTKDGVFILSHDPTFGNYTLEEHTWDELKDVTITVTRNSGIPEGGTYTAKLCTLQRYLEICKQYNVTAVIELKTSKGISNWTEQNQPQSSRMPDLIKEIEEADMINNVIFLTSQYECLAWTRRNGYDFIECQYLVSSCENQTYLATCIKYDLDISMNVRDNTKNSDEWLKKYKDAGLKIAAYTFEQYATYEDIQACIDRGYDYVTTDWHDMSKCNLPENDK